MKISELDVNELVRKISVAIAPVIFSGVSENTPASLSRERVKIMSEIMGRIGGVLASGDELGPDLHALIAAYTDGMKEGYEESFSYLLRPRPIPGDTR
ncbi:hypothetical protein ACIOVF_23950 [Pseudomonas sp. NPDC087612]|uniref:hypothetical protein n=1 Tax=Pseudomonas sp. NPDC087612 TaxID=3364441 RepID=UPI00380374DC